MVAPCRTRTVIATEAGTFGSFTDGFFIMWLVQPRRMKNWESWEFAVPGCPSLAVEVDTRASDERLHWQQSAL